MGVGRALRIGGAVALLVAGLVHLDLYFGGYRDAGSVPSFGRSILFNAIASGVIGAAVAPAVSGTSASPGSSCPPPRWPRSPTRTPGTRCSGSKETGSTRHPRRRSCSSPRSRPSSCWPPTFIPSIAARDESSGMAVLGAAGVVAAGVLVGFGAYWASEDTESVSATGPGAVSIANFAFSPEALEVPAGTAVTWTNNDDLDHSVVAADDSFRSDQLGNGSSYEFTFDDRRRVQLRVRHPSGDVRQRRRLRLISGCDWAGDDHRDGGTVDRGRAADGEGRPPGHGGSGRRDTTGADLLRRDRRLDRRRRRPQAEAPPATAPARRHRGDGFRGRARRSLRGGLVACCGGSG